MNFGAAFSELFILSSSLKLLPAIITTFRFSTSFSLMAHFLQFLDMFKPYSFSKILKYPPTALQPSSATCIFNAISSHHQVKFLRASRHWVLGEHVQWEMCCVCLSRLLSAHCSQLSMTILQSSFATNSKSWKVKSSHLPSLL